jgi:hypothetical protein
MLNKVKERRWRERPLAEINNKRELETWLRKQPREVSVAFAARVALRVLPFMQGARHSEGYLRNLVLPVFRATAISWAAAKYPAHEIKSGAVFAARPDVTAALLSAGTAIDAAFHAATATVAATIATAAAIAANATGAASITIATAAAIGVRPALWSAVSDDATRVEHGGAAADIAGLPQWSQDQPDQIQSMWKEMKAELLTARQDWQVWTFWYDDRLEGHVRDEERELAYVRIEETLWDQGPAIVNAEIKRRIEELEPPPRVVKVSASVMAGGSGRASLSVAEPTPPRRRKKKPESSLVPEIPPQRPAALEPVWSNGKLVLPARSARTDGDKRANAAALKALRAELVELADDVEAEPSNFDKRAAAYLRRVAERISGRSPPQHELFRLAHAKEYLQAYGTTVNDQWPEHLAARYHALTLHFDRTVRQFPKWREFVRNAKEDRLTHEQAAKVPALANDFGELLRNQEAQEFIGPQIPASLEALQAPLQSEGARSEIQNLDPIEAGKLLLAEDVVESISNIAKRLSESALGVYVSDLGKGIDEDLRKSGKPDGKKVAAFLKKAVVTLTAASLLYLFPQLAWIIPLKFIFGRRSSDKSP